MKRIVIIGTGGHAKVIAEVARMCGCMVIGWVDQSREVGSLWKGAPVLGTSEQWPVIVKRVGEVACVVAIGDNAIRGRVVNEILQTHPQQEFATLIHPSAVVSSSVQLGAGTMVFAGVVIQPDCQVGDHVILNTSCSVDHDGVLGDFCSVAPGAHLGGEVTLGEYVALGIGASVIHGRQIGAHTVVGAGAAVTQDVPEFSVAMGVPAVVKRTRIQGERYL